MRTKQLQIWPKDHGYVLRLRELNKISNPTYDTFKKGIENEDLEISANVIIGLIKVVSYLLYNQIKSLETAFIQEGGLRERMTKARIDQRNKDKKDM